MLLIISAVLYCSFCSGQVILENTDLKNNDSAIIFKSVANHFELVGDNVPELNVIQIKGGKMFRKSYNSFVVDYIESDTVQIEVSEMIGDDKKILISKVFKSVNIGEPSVELIFTKDTTYSNGQIINWSRLVVKFDNQNYTGSWEVAHFELSIFDSNGSVIKVPTFQSGKYLSKKNTDIFFPLNRGSKIIFSNIVLKYPDGEYRKYPDLIHVKN